MKAPRTSIVLGTVVASIAIASVVAATPITFRWSIRASGTELATQTIESARTISLSKIEHCNFWGNVFSEGEDHDDYTA